MTGEQDAETVRQRVVYRGHVQGVLFRATSADLARRFNVVGNVRNAPDGTVELEAEGPLPEVQRFLAQVARRFEGYVTDTSRTTLPVRGDETRFEIRYW
jgi:acylphosphatase